MGNFKGGLQPFKHQPHKIVKHTQAIRWQQLTHFLNVLDHFVRLALKELTIEIFAAAPKIITTVDQYSLKCSMLVLPTVRFLKSLFFLTNAQGCVLMKSNS